MADFRSKSAITTHACKHFWAALIHGSKNCCFGECNSVMAAAAESRPGNRVSREIFSIASSFLNLSLQPIGIVSVQ